MPRRIRIADGIIIDKRVPIPGLRPLRGGGDDRVGLEEASQRAVVPTRLEEVNAEAGFLALSRKFVVRVEIAVSIPRFAKGFVERGGGLCAVRVRGDG